VAQKLKSEYGFSYDNLKVLLGGWTTWSQENAKNPSAYPISTAPGATPGSSDGGKVVTATVQLQPAPANTVAPQQ
jgi:hypothetical protein